MSMPASLERSIRRAQRTRWSFPITAFIASSRVKCVSSKYHSPIHTRAGASSTRHAPPPAYAAVTAAPHRPHRGYRLPARRHRGQRLTIPLEARSCPAPGVRRAASPSAQQVQRTFPIVPRAAPTLCADTGLRPNLGLPRTTNATCITAGVPLCGRPPSARNLSAFHVHPQRHTAPLVDDSASPPPMRSTPRGFPSPAPAAFAAMTRLWASSGRTRRRCTPRASTNTRIPR
ncbi:hypothetical protein B0H13DRAFT_921192 [Mycena leptocephala]|nr:hypothetical protein B0H13DRAFT_921192 [Mycena leptocephala]